MTVKTIRCDCIKKLELGIKVAKPEGEQQTVVLQSSLDPRYISGQCLKCKKIHVEKKIHDQIQ